MSVLVSEPTSSNEVDRFMVMEAGFVFKPGWYGNGKAEFGFKPGLEYLSCDGG